MPASSALRSRPANECVALLTFASPWQHLLPLARWQPTPASSNVRRARRSHGAALRSGARKRAREGKPKTMSDLVVTGLSKSYGSVAALRGIGFSVSAGEFFVVLGPSAAGKTTLLRSIAGLERPEAGRIVFGGQDLTDRPVRGRDMAMIFQTFALYPHLTIHDNLAYPLREAGVPAGEIARRVGEIA